MIYDVVPMELRSTPQWVVWRREPDAKDPAKMTKVPYRAAQPKRRASSTDPDTWGTFEVAMHAVERDMTLAGPGFVVTKDIGVVGIDLDHCINEQQQLEPWASAIVTELDSYTEVSPSGQGLRVFARGHLPGIRRKRADIEAYDSGRFLTVTANHFPDTPLRVEERGSELATFYSRYLDPPTEQRVLPEPTHQLYDDAGILARARNARSGARFILLFDHGDIAGYPSHSEADLALCTFLANAGADALAIDNLMRSSRLFRSKWDDQHGAQTYGERTIATALASRVAPLAPHAPQKEQTPLEVEAEKQLAQRFHLLRDDELESLQEPEPLIHGILPFSCNASVFGKSGSLKSFLCLDVACCVGSGRDWHGHDVRQGLVVYICPEGSYGMRRRVSAWKTAYEHSGTVNVYFLPAPAYMTDLVEVRSLIAAIRQLPAAAVLVVIDTLNRNMQGNENAAEDMTRFIAGCDLIRVETGATVLVVHHTGHSETAEDRGRGHSSWPAALDTEIQVVRDGDRITVSCSKQKDAEEFEPLVFDAVPTAKSLTLMAVRNDTSTLSKNERKILGALEKILKEGLSAKQLGDETGLPQPTTYRALNRLQDLGYVKRDRMRFIVTGSGILKLRENSQ